MGDGVNPPTFRRGFHLSGFYENEGLALLVSAVPFPWRREDYCVILPMNKKILKIRAFFRERAGSGKDVEMFDNDSIGKMPGNRKILKSRDFFLWNSETRSRALRGG